MEKIGLEAILNMGGFNRGLSQYLRGISQMNMASTAGAAALSGTGVAAGGLGSALAAIGGPATIAITAVVAIAAAVAATTAAFVALSKAGIDAAIKVESAFAGVIKTVDGLVDSENNLTEAGQELKAAFVDLSTQLPMSAEDLMAIGEAAGQLGVRKEDILSFTKVMADLGTTTNLSATEAAMALARFMNVMGTAQSDVDRVGSAIVALGNNFATTEAEITNMAQNMAGAGSIAGLTESDVLGLATAISSVGIEAAAGGSSMQRALLDINQAVMEGEEQLERYAMVSGMAAEDFATLWKEDAAEAFTRFVEGLGRSGDDATKILEEMSLSDIRLMRTLLSLAEAEGTVRDAVELSSDAYEENIALVEEAEQRYATTISKIEILKNKVTAFVLAIGDYLMPFVDQVVDALGTSIVAIGEKLPQVMETWVIPVVKALSDVLTWVIEQLGDKLPKAIDWAVAAWEDYFIPVLTEVRLAFGDFVDALMLLIEAMAKPMAAGAATFISAWILMRDAVVWSADQMRLAYENISDNTETALENILTYLGPWAEKILPILEEVQNFILDVVANVIERLAAEVRLALETVSFAATTFASVWTYIKRVFAGEDIAAEMEYHLNRMTIATTGWKIEFQTLIDTWKKEYTAESSEALKKVQTVVAEGLKVIQGEFGVAYKFLDDITGGTWSSIYGTTLGYINEILAAMGYLHDQAVNIASATARDVISTLNRALGRAGDIIGAIGVGIADAISVGVGVGLEFPEFDWDAFEDIGTEAGEAAGTAAGIGFGETFEEAIEDQLASLGSTIAALATTYGELFASKFMDPLAARIEWLEDMISAITSSAEAGLRRLQDEAERLLDEEFEGRRQAIEDELETKLAAIEAEADRRKDAAEEQLDDERDRREDAIRDTYDVYEQELKDETDAFKKEARERADIHKDAIRDAYDVSEQELRDETDAFKKETRERLNDQKEAIRDAFDEEQRLLRALYDERDEALNKEYSEREKALRDQWLTEEQMAEALGALDEERDAAQAILDEERRLAEEALADREQEQIDEVTDAYEAAIDEREKYDREAKKRLRDEEEDALKAVTDRYQAEVDAREHYHRDAMKRLRDEEEDALEKVADWYETAMEDALTAIDALAKKYSDLLTGYYQPRLDELDEEYRFRLAQIGEMEANYDALHLAAIEQLLRLKAELAKHEEHILELQKAQAALGLLQQQMQLLALIEEYGLDIADILAGLDLGLTGDIGIEDIIANMTTALWRIIEAVKTELGIASASQVMAEEVGAPLAQGIAAGLLEGLGDLVQPAAVLSSTSMMQSDRYVTLNLDMGGQTFAGQGDARQFADYMVQRVGDALRGI